MGKWILFYPFFSDEETDAMRGDLPKVVMLAVEPEPATRHPHAKPRCHKVLCTTLLLSPFGIHECTVWKSALL